MQFLMCLLLLSEILPHTGNFFLMQSPHLLCFFQLPQWGPPGWTETNQSSDGGLQALSMWGELVRMSCPHAVLAKVFSWLSLFSFKITKNWHNCGHVLGFQIKLIQAISLLGELSGTQLHSGLLPQESYGHQPLLCEPCNTRTHFLHPLTLFWEPHGFNLHYGLFSIPGTWKFLYHPF